jgi:uncharacterized BrkB/YihY/UPF0761 family membrane protein
MSDFLGLPINTSGLLLWLIWLGVAFCVGAAICEVVTSRRRRYEDLERHPDDPEPRTAKTKRRLQ